LVQACQEQQEIKDSQGDQNCDCRGNVFSAPYVLLIHGAAERQPSGGGE
jgi:hypothetical protein